MKRPNSYQKMLAVGAAGLVAIAAVGATAASALEGSGGDAHPRPGVMAKAVLKSAGVTREEAKQAATEGKSFSEAITAYGDKSVPDVKAETLAALSTRLDSAVSAGKITQEKADAAEAKAPEAFDQLMAREVRAGTDGRGGRVGRVVKEMVGTVAKTLGMEPKAVAERLKAGETVAEIAGPRTAEVTSALEAAADARIDKGVADGKLTPEKGESLKAKAKERIGVFVNTPHTGPKAETK